MLFASNLRDKRRSENCAPIRGESRVRTRRAFGQARCGKFPIAFQIPGKKKPFERWTAHFSHSHESLAVGRKTKRKDPIRVDAKRFLDFFRRLSQSPIMVCGTAVLPPLPSSMIRGCPGKTHTAV